MDNASQGAAPSGADQSHSEPGATQLAAVSGTPIGQISAAPQPVHVTHADGSSEDLGVGGQIYADDVIHTPADGGVEIVFVDGTKFTLGGNAEMQIDKLIYDPAGSDNSLAVSVVQGAFVFVTGTIAGAPGEGMEVSTPAGNIGVRGTSVGGHYSDGPEGWTLALFKDENGHVGKVVVFNSAGEVILDEQFESTKLIDFSTPPTVPVILTKEQIEELFGPALDFLPDLRLQNEFEQRGELDNFNTAAGGNNSGGPNHGSHFYTFGLANFVFGGLGGVIPATALGDNGPLGGTKLLYNEPGGPQDPDDKQFQDNGPFGMALGGGHIAENSPVGTVAGFVAAILGGPSNATYTFSLVDEGGASTFRIMLFAAEPSPAFEIDPNTGVITVHNAELMDFETTPEFFLTVRATNQNGQSVDVPFQVHLDDVNDNAPVIEPLGPLDLAENSAAGTVVGQVTSHDVDTTGEATVYSILEESDPNHYFAIDPATGEITLTEAGAASGLLDYESDQSHSITLKVVASDGTNTSDPIDVEIDITDVNEAVWSISGSTFVSEGGTAVYTVSYSGETLAPGETMTIDVETHPGSADGSDFDGVTTTLTFTGGGTTSMTVAVSTVSDTVIEGNEDYSVAIGNPSHGNTANDEVNTTIGDGADTILGWQIEGTSTVEEGQEAIYTVSYSGATLAPGQIATVTVQTHDGGAEEGSDKDYIGVDQVLTFTGGGETMQTVAVQTLSDTLIESSEDYSIDLISDIGTTGSGVTTEILDPPPPLEWSIDGVSTVTEGGNAIYTVSYGGGTLAEGEVATVTIDTASGTATEDEDFTGAHTVLTFTGGQSQSQTIEVATTDDNTVEDDETYSVSITGTDHGNIVNGQVDTTIANNDVPLEWSIFGASTVTEGDATVYTVTYSGGTLGDGETATVTIDTASGTATEGEDFLGQHTILTFTGGDTHSQTVQVSTIGDNDVESDETYTVSITGTDHGNISNGQAGTTITDNDVAPDDGRLDGVIGTLTNHSERPVVLTFVDENPVAEGDPLHAYSRLIVVGSEAAFTTIDADAGFVVDDTRTYRAAIEMPSITEGSSLDVTGVTLEGVAMGPSDGVTLGYDNLGENDSMPGHPVGISGILDPETGDALLPMRPSRDFNGSNDSIFGNKNTDDYLFGADGNDTIQGSSDPEIINGGHVGFNGTDVLMGGGGDDIIVFNNDAFIDGGSGFNIVRVDDGALQLYQSDKAGEPIETSDTVDLGNAYMANVDMILITEDADADSKRGTALELDAGTADRMPRSQDSESDAAANLFIVGSKGDKLNLLDFGNGWDDGNGDVPGLQPVGHYDDGKGQSFDIYQTNADTYGRVTNVYVDTDIEVTSEAIGA
ncbi:hypothetical protein FRZ61_24970 [Hypericibacter adhaerens]|uniref:Cadherin domain-containing protein n=1 Tax=Hypericibacter adhaerens TaxID=2602016 RepID=A0A5J6N0T4_9PROT|nr:Calx-beta domain-containing protein [Hypericibacter adhaerens]QEX22565.1 hypothetical protein FRZ61_24970 [Hypericibacter adhaerens]